MSCSRKKHSCIRTVVYKRPHVSIHLLFDNLRLSFSLDVCAAADNGESLRGGLENDHSHCAHSLVQHSKVGWAGACTLNLLSPSRFVFVCRMKRNQESSAWRCEAAPPCVAAGRPIQSRLAPIRSITIIRILRHSHRYKHSLLLSHRQGRRLCWTPTASGRRMHMKMNTCEWKASKELTVFILCCN